MNTEKRKTEKRECDPYHRKTLEAMREAKRISRDPAVPAYTGMDVPFIAKATGYPEETVSGWVTGN